MKSLNDRYLASIEAHFEANKRSAAVMREYINHCSARYHGGPIYSLYCPKLFSEESEQVIRHCAETMHRILEKVIAQYLSSPEYRKMYGFSPEMEELILLDTGYDRLLPMARVDIFLNEETMEYKFCEFNADGTSAMNEDRELCLATRYAAAFQDLEQEYEIRSFELFDSWAQSFLRIFHSSAMDCPTPHVAVVDFLEKGCSMEEFERFAQAFRKAGATSEVAELRDLVYREGALFSPTGKKIDAIYRRAVTCDVMANRQDAQALLQAVKEGAVCLIGGFRTQVIHDKLVFVMLHTPETQAFLTQEEIDFIKAHVPFTARLTSQMEALPRILSDKDNWIIKPEDSYGARGIFPGRFMQEDEWKKAVEGHLDKHYIVQEFTVPYKSLNIDFRKKPARFAPVSNLTGLYVYDGKFAGVYSRQSAHGIISTEYDENDIASFVAVRKEHQ